MVLEYWGTSKTQTEIAAAVYDDVTKGTSPAALWYYAKSLGFNTEYKTLTTIYDLQNYLEQKIPVIVSQNFSMGSNTMHFRIVIGYDDSGAGTITTVDPITGIFPMSFNSFTQLWAASYNWSLAITPSLYPVPSSTPISTLPDTHITTPTPVPSPTATMVPTPIAVPFYFQEKSTWCGPAALQMVLAYWGTYKTQTEIAAAVYDNITQGTSASAMQSYPQVLGFNSTAQSYTSIQVLEQYIQMKIPVIVGQYLTTGSTTGHYRIVIGYDNSGEGTIITLDPLGGILPMSFWLFIKLWAAYDNWSLAITPGLSPTLSPAPTATPTPTPTSTPTVTQTPTPTAISTPSQSTIPSLSPTPTTTPTPTPNSPTSTPTQSAPPPPPPPPTATPTQTPTPVPTTDPTPTPVPSLTSTPLSTQAPETPEPSPTQTQPPPSVQPTETTIPELSVVATFAAAAIITMLLLRTKKTTTNQNRTHHDKSTKKF